MKLIIDVDDKDYAMLKNTSITLDWNTICHGKEKDKELTFATFNLIKALVDGLSYEERPQGDLISREALKISFKEHCCGECDCCVHQKEGFSCELIDNAPTVELFCSYLSDGEVRQPCVEAPCKHERPQGEWIPCSERLPDDMKKVLVWYEYYRYGDFNCMYQTYGFCYVCDGKWSPFINGETGWTDARIIAWQPLPKPYDSEVHDD